MDLLSIILIAIGLAMDAFSVAAVTGFVLGSFSIKQALMQSFTFGFFQFFMPIAGWMAGSSIAPLIADYDHWVAFGMLAIIGGKMIWEGARAGTMTGSDRPDPTKGSSLLVFSIATSIDALAVGLTFAFSSVAVLYPAVVIGITAALFSLLGIHLGSKSSRLFGRYAEPVGGAILIFIGLRILTSHIL